MNSIQLTQQQQTIGYIICICMVSVLVRVQITQSLFFGFLIWNLFLAVIPYAISEAIKKNTFSTPVSILLGFIWMLFLPNAPYLITDLIHLQHTKSTLIWYDLVMIFCFANTGLLLTMVSLINIHTVILKKYNGKYASRFTFIISLLCGYGIYLGRVLRFNSWDAIQAPKLLFTEIFFSFLSTQTWCFTFGFGAIIWLTFNLFYKKNDFFIIKKQPLN